MLNSKRARHALVAAAGLAFALPLAACGSSSTKPTATTIKPTGTTAAATGGSTSTTVKK
jgi:ABC-type uncharacterized transport system auxiliary subunit